MKNELKASKFNVCIKDNQEILIANTLTGAIIELSQTEFAVFCDNFKCLPEDVINTLYQLGILIDYELDEINLLRRTYFQSKNSNSIIRITICPTLDCNFACPYCYEYRHSGAMSNIVQKGVILYIENLLKQQPECLAICWYGGEPLLCPDIIDKLSIEIISLCEKYNVKYKATMISNGYLINKPVLKVLNEIRLSSIQITIDGPPQIHNIRRFLKNGGATFDKIVEGIKQLNESGILVRLRVNLDKMNIKYYTEIKKMFIGYKNVFCYPAIVTVEDTQTDTQRNRCFTHDEYSLFYNQIDLPEELLNAFEDIIGQGISTCMAENEYSCVIDQEGFVYKCLNDVGKVKYAVSSVINNDICSPIAVAKYLGRDPFSEVECCNCPYIPLCLGRCVWEYKDKNSHACPAIKYYFGSIVKEKYRKT